MSVADAPSPLRNPSSLAASATPVARPGPSVAVVIRFGDEWMPLCRQESYADDIKRLGEMAAEAGREPIPASLFMAPPDTSRLKKYEEEGFSRFIFYLPPQHVDKLLPQLDDLSEIVHKFD